MNKTAKGIVKILKTDRVFFLGGNEFRRYVQKWDYKYQNVLWPWTQGSAGEMGSTKN
jgi:hypothetical protein